MGMAGLLIIGCSENPEMIEKFIKQISFDDISKDGTLIKNNPYEGIINFINEDIFLALSLGYQDNNIDEHVRLAKHTNVGEDKPNFEDIIHWQKI
jgi:hypothetical protein